MQMQSPDARTHGLDTRASVMVHIPDTPLILAFDKLS
jgi:hypothetical protein